MTGSPVISPSHAARVDLPAAPGPRITTRLTLAMVPAWRFQSHHAPSGEHFDSSSFAATGRSPWVAQAPSSSGLDLVGLDYSIWPGGTGACKASSSGSAT